MGNHGGSSPFIRTSKPNVCIVLGVVNVCIELLKPSWLFSYYNDLLCSCSSVTLRGKFLNEVSQSIATKNNPNNDVPEGPRIVLLRRPLM